jgi:hypothetical protein
MSELISKKRNRIKKVNECLTDHQVDDICRNTDLCDDKPERMNIEILDIESLNERLYELKLEQETDRNNLGFFENQIMIRQQEIERLIMKIKLLEESEL